MSNSQLFESLQVGRYALKHRIVMAPLTRSRAEEGNIPNDLMAEYYKQRASDGGLLISEATPIHPLTLYNRFVPGIYTPLQIEEWKKTTEAVHAKGGVIFLQMWHIGYHCRPEFDEPLHRLPPCPSVMLDEETGAPKTREMSVDEIEETVRQFAQAATNAIEAGFDGVEIHGANTYLIDQFLSDKVNQRTDAYGGSVEKRCRFAMEVTRAVCDAVGADRVGIRFSPWAISTVAVEQYSCLLGMLNPLKLAYVHVVRPYVKESQDGMAVLRKVYEGVLMVCREYDPVTAGEVVERGSADLVAFGKLFISNPDLVQRIAEGGELAKWDASTFYTRGPVGYVDYKTAEELVSQ
ncbi:hypothetical protein HDU98_000486 [Podochytrium sp. JEL0797]|nr:hypothetical protein HDU98_000486 [Podochytrium sp. JEL0797]